MSSNTTTNPFPPGVNSLAAIDASLQGLLIEHTILVLLIPLLIALFYYSTPYTRRQPLFILNVFAIMSAFTAGTIGDILNVRAMLLQQNTVPLQIAIGFICNFQSIFVDLILLVRLISVHPLRCIGLLRFVLLTTLPITLKFARVVNTIVYIRELTIMGNGPDGAEKVGTAWLTLPYLRMEWIAQMVDNSYASIMFIWTIRNIGVSISSRRLTNVASFRHSSFSVRIRMLFHFALSNFIIPTVLSIVQIGVLFQLGEAHPSLIYLALVNARLSVFGVVFATVWAGKERRREANTSSNHASLELDERCTGGLEVWRVATTAEDSQDGNPTATSGKDGDNRDDVPVERHGGYRNLQSTGPCASCKEYPDGKNPPGIPQDVNYEIPKSHVDPGDCV